MNCFAIIKGLYLLTVPKVISWIITGTRWNFSIIVGHCPDGEQWFISTTQVRDVLIVGNLKGTWLDLFIYRYFIQQHETSLRNNIKWKVFLQLRLQTLFKVGSSWYPCMLFEVSNETQYYLMTGKYELKIHASYFFIYSFFLEDIIANLKSNTTDYKY